jgi:hypothetical protein
MTMDGPVISVTQGVMVMLAAAEPPMLAVSAPLLLSVPVFLTVTDVLVAPYKSKGPVTLH